MLDNEIYLLERKGRLFRLFHHSSVTVTVLFSFYSALGAKRDLFAWAIRSVT